MIKNILSLFDGISCGQLALNRANIKFDKYFASEIDPYAIKITQKNFPNTIQLGDVTKIKATNLPKIDLLIGGSPCQGFSFAGKQLNFNDPRSKLFFEFVRLLNELKPKYFLLENVKMKKEYQDIISSHLKVQPILINSALVSAQNRKRLYWTNITDITQPADKHIYLKDILEENVDEKFYIKAGHLQWFIKNKDYNFKKSFCSINPDKTLPLLARQYASWRGNFIDENKPIRLGHFNSGGQGDRFYSTEAKSVCLSALGGGRGAKTGLYTIAQRGRNLVAGKRKDILGAPTYQRFETSCQEKSNTLTAVQKDSLVLSIEEKDYRIRKLTPIECERLQTLPDNYTEGISNSQRYKSLGNAWTVDVIAHILSHIPKPLQLKPISVTQRYNLFNYF